MNRLTLFPPYDSVEAPLVAQVPGTKLRNCITSICERAPCVDLYKMSRIALKAAGAAVSAIAKIPYIPISLKLGKVLGPISTIGNISGFFILEYWACSGAVDDFLGPKTEAEIELFQDRRSTTGKKFRTIAIVSVSSLIALFSQLPTALAGVEYNPEKFKLVAGFVLLLAGSLIPIRSLQLLIEQVRLNIQKTAKYEVTKIKNKMIRVIREANEGFLQKNYESKLALIDSLNQIRGSPSLSLAGRTDQYILHLLQIDSTALSRTKKVVGAVINYTGMIIGTTLAGIFEYAFGEYTFSLTKQTIYDNSVVGGIFAAAVVGSTVYLFGKSITQTAQRTFNVFGNLLIGKEIRNLGWQLKPKLSFTLTAVGLMIDLCALGPTYVIWGDFYQQNEITHHLFQKTMCGAIFLLLFTSTLDIIDQLVTSFINRGSPEEQEIMLLNIEFQKLVELIEKSPSQEFIEYLINIPEAARDVLLRRMSVSLSEINACTALNLEISEG